MSIKERFNSAVKIASQMRQQPTNDQTIKKNNLSILEFIKNRFIFNKFIFPQSLLLNQYQ